MTEPVRKPTIREHIEAMCRRNGWKIPDWTTEVEADDAGNVTERKPVPKAWSDTEKEEP